MSRIGFHSATVEILRDIKNFCLLISLPWEDVYSGVVASVGVQFNRN